MCAGESGFPAQKPVESAKEGEDEEQYSDEFEESEEEGVQVEKDDRSTNDNVERPSGLVRQTFIICTPPPPPPPFPRDC